MERSNRHIKLGKELVSQDELFKVEPTLDMNASIGVALDQKQQEYMLPHFLMMLVGKPGSGKTTLLQKLVNSKQFYYHKFDKIFVVSPSYQKLPIQVDEKNKTADFSLDWIFDKIAEINRMQEGNIINNRTNKMVAAQGQNSLLPGGVPAGGHTTMRTSGSLGRGGVSTTLRPVDSFMSNRTSLMQDLGREMLGSSIAATGKKQVVVDKLEKTNNASNILSNLPKDVLSQVRPFNALFIFDDVVGQIKKAESDPRIARLFFNRRHLIHVGTISIMVVTQKYMRIPTQIRSNASWLILFKINPKDFNNVYEDAISLSKQKWDDIVQFAFDMDADGVSTLVKKEKQKDSSGGIKSFNSLGIWVEKDIYFKNFQRIILQ